MFSKSGSSITTVGEDGRCIPHRLTMYLADINARMPRQEAGAIYAKIKEIGMPASLNRQRTMLIVRSVRNRSKALH